MFKGVVTPTDFFKSGTFIKISISFIFEIIIYQFIAFNTSGLISLFLINLAGIPPHISQEGISLVTTDPAATIEKLPIVTGFVIIVCAPIKT